MKFLPLDHETQHQAPRKPATRDDPKLSSGRIAVFQYAAVGIFLFLIAGFWDLQVRNPELYNELAERNRVKYLPIVAPRGKILDRDGRVIVDNHSSFRVILSRETLKLDHLRPIAEGLRLDNDDLAAQLRRYRNRPKYEPVVIKQELTPADVAFVESHKDPEFFPEMELIHSQGRIYPQEGVAAHVIGYTGEVSEAELDLPEFARYNTGDVIGKFGIERQYNDTLMGVDGQRQVVVDNRGREREVIGIKEAIPGKNLQLTIDLDLQAVAELAMEGRKGAVVALDPRTGEVLAMVSRPIFDPNKFSVRIKTADWKSIIDDPDHPLLNRAIQAQFAPGSTFKPIMAIAGLETGTIDDTTSFFCGGGASFYGHFHKCHLKGGHGTVALHKGIVNSCDVFFYNVGNRMDIDDIAYYADNAGLGQKTGVDLPHEAEGIVPSTKWKIRMFRQKWYQGENISVAIGQGALTVTPIQLARAIGGLAMGGVWHRPHLVKNQPDKPHELELDPENVEKVISGMCGVVNEAGGTGVRAHLAGVEVCGKTGTAQLTSNEYAKSRGIKIKDNAWFVGFAPRKDPEIVVVALFEGGEHGQLAAPIVRDVIKAYFDKKARGGGPPDSLSAAAKPAPPVLTPAAVPVAEIP
ncbi:MAG: penicillin-binding protein 2 [Candidatus Solibacter usitatus]|nr:penicillin-binding protein 2 [Candidatus Solibacter usitatus]